MAKIWKDSVKQPNTIVVAHPGEVKEVNSYSITTIPDVKTKISNVIIQKTSILTEILST